MSVEEATRDPCHARTAKARPCPNRASVTMPDGRRLCGIHAGKEARAGRAIPGAIVKDDVE